MIVRAVTPAGIWSLYRWPAVGWGEVAGVHQVLIRTWCGSWVGWRVWRLVLEGHWRAWTEMCGWRALRRR